MCKEHNKTGDPKTFSVYVKSMESLKINTMGTDEASKLIIFSIEEGRGDGDGCKYNVNKHIYLRYTVTSQWANVCLCYRKTKH